MSISALQILGISAISDPATAMLDMILAAIPLVLAAAILLGIGALIAKFAGTLLENILHGVGTDRFAAQLGVEPSQTSVSSILAKVAQVAILLFFAIMAARTLGFPEITVLLNEILELGGRVLFGAAVIGAGFFIANLLARMVGSRPAATMIRYGTLPSSRWACSSWGSRIRSSRSPSGRSSSAVHSPRPWRSGSAVAMPQPALNRLEERKRPTVLTPPNRPATRTGRQPDRGYAHRSAQ